MPRLDRLRLPHHIPPRARVLFVGINPGVRSALTGHHFAGASNRFWRLLRDSGLVPVILTPEQDASLRDYGYGITNLVSRPTAGISDLTPDDFAAGRRALLSRIRRLRPRLVALVGVTAYRALFSASFARGGRCLGAAPGRLAGSPVFVLPNPSGRNATLTYAEMLRVYRGLARRVAPPARRARTSLNAGARLLRARRARPGPKSRVQLTIARIAPYTSPSARQSR